MKQTKKNQGAENPNARVNKYQVEIIRHLNKNYRWKVKKLIKLFPQVKQAQMYNIINGLYWK